MLTEALKGNKIRNIDEKIRQFNQHHQITIAFDHRFCKPKLEAEKHQLSQNLAKKYEKELTEARDALAATFQNDLKAFKQRYETQMRQINATKGKN